MSLSISAAVPVWPIPSNRWNRLVEETLNCREGWPQSAWDGSMRRIWWHGVSTTVVEVSREVDAIRIAVRECACAEDHAIALRILESLVDDPATEIRIDYGSAVPFGEAASTLGPAALRRRAEDSAHACREEVEFDGTVVSVIGPVRGYRLGPRRTGELVAAGPLESFPSRLFDDIRRVQYGGATGGRESAGGLVVGLRCSDRRVSATIWTPGTPLCVPGCFDAILVRDPEAESDGGYVMIAKSMLPAIAGPLFAGWLDEDSALLDAGDDATWAGVIRRARAASFEAGLLLRGLDVRPMMPVAPPPRRPWWRLW